MADLRIAIVWEGSKVRPVWIDRRGRRIDVKAVTFEWTSMLGSELLRHYAVVDAAGNSYELVFNAVAMRWTCTP